MKVIAWPFDAPQGPKGKWGQWPHCKCFRWGRLACAASTLLSLWDLCSPLPNFLFYSQLSLLKSSILEINLWHELIWSLASFLNKTETSMNLSLLICKMRIIIINDDDVTSWVWDKMKEKTSSYCPWKACENPGGWAPTPDSWFYWANPREKGAKVTTGVSCVEFTLNKIQYTCS